MRCTFVILHYMASDVTSRSINAVLALHREDDISVVVVDNASPDGSGPSLKEAYSGFPRVHFVLLETNEGFARGNNAGYSYAVGNLNPDFVVIMNNDVIVNDAEFIRKIETEYTAEPFAVLGPDIVTPASFHQNPLRTSPMTLRQIRTLRLKMSLKYWLYPIVRMFAFAEGKSSSKGSHCAFAGDCVLHGACYIFSRDFITVRRHAFNPSTFLYCEEDILQAECAARGLVCRYAPSLKVLHLEDCSSKAAVHSSWRRARLKYRRLIDSLSVLLTVRKSMK